MKICLSADKSYQQHLIATMASVILSANPDDELEFIVLSDGSIDEGCFEQLKRHKAFEVQVINAAQLVHEHMEIAPDCKWSTAVFYRLLLPIICKSDSRIIYLDSDVIVRTSLRDLWDMPMEHYSIAGVADTGFDHKERLKRHGIEIEGWYLNSGVMVWHMDRIRADHFSDKLVMAGQRLASAEFPDQDWINMMFDKDKLILPVKWNVMSHLFSHEAMAAQQPYPAEELAAATASPFICHFTNVKPWTMSYTEHPYWVEYWEYLKMTPYSRKVWKGYIKKTCLNNEEGFFLRIVRPAIKKVFIKGDLNR